MNISLYLFGDFKSGYGQYPIDYTSDIFESFHSHSKADTQVGIHRDGNLMYYAYIRKFEDNKYFGICAVINGAMLTQIDGLFKMFETALGMLISRGTYVRFSDDGSITTGDGLFSMDEEYTLLFEYIRGQLGNLPSSALPPVNFSVANDSVKDFTIEDDESKIINSSSSYAYTFIYKSKGYDTAQVNSYKGIIARHKKQNDELQKRCDDLSSKLTKERIKQRNMKWVGVLGGIILILGVILWNKVLFPSEVTHYETGEFTYYGPLDKQKKPNGVGVAIYPDNDSQKRKFYIGHFVNGRRQDEHAMLLYQSGDYYYGSMSNDQWFKGILYRKTDNSHFEGEFHDNKPYNGKWYEHKAVISVKDGTERY